MDRGRRLAYAAPTMLWALLRNTGLCLLTMALASGCTVPEESPAVGEHAAAMSTSSSLDAYYLVLQGPAAVEVVRPGESFTAPHIKKRIAAQLQRLEIQHAELRPKIEAQGARVMADLVRLANVVQVLARADVIERLRALPEVVSVERVPQFSRQLVSAVPVTRAPQLWMHGAPLHGEGVRIGIIDSGIDYMHADFGGSGDPQDYENNDSSIVEPGSFPTTRVVDGYDFVGDDYNPSQEENSMPLPDHDPLDCLHADDAQIAGGHGTHVAGIAGGNGVLADGTAFLGPYAQSLELNQFVVGPGVAPLADLVGLRVFGCNGGTSMLAASLEWAADPNEDGVFDDRLDVVNASLGTAFGLQSETNATLVANLTTVGSLFVVAAGNEGATFYATGSPGNYPQALSVAASADNDFLALQIESPASIVGEMPASEGGFTTKMVQTGPISGNLVATVPADACSSIQNSSAVAGHIAFIDRGNCTFVSKFNRAVTAGALAVVIADHEYDDWPFAMGGGDPGEVAIPGVMIRRVDGDTIKAHLAEGVSVTLDGSMRYSGLGAEVFTSFSSRGPSTVDNLLKPEISAPGYSIDSAQVGSGFDSRRKQGTSMACPVVAGAAALLRQAEPQLSPIDVKARLMNTATILMSEARTPYPVSRQGAGRVDIEEATQREVIARAEGDDGRVAVSFGALTTDVPLVESRVVRLDNYGDTAISYQVSAQQLYVQSGVSVTMDPSEIEVAPQGSATVNVLISIDPAALGAPAPDPLTPLYQYDLPRHHLDEVAGLIHFTDPKDEQSIGLPFHAVVRAAANRKAGKLVGCSAEEAVSIPISGESAHPDPVVTAFELGVEDEALVESAESEDAARIDLRAVGVATNYATTEDFDEVSLYFGLAVEGEWTTPAQGVLSAVGIAIDVDDDKDSDYVIVAEPFTKEGPYADVLAATTYDLENGNQLPSKRYLNMVAANEYATHPFNNGVVVLSVFANELGLSKTQGKLNYFAFTQSTHAEQDGESTDWASFDLTAPRVDTARSAPKPGRPLYAKDQPIRAHLAIDPESEGEGGSDSEGDSGAEDEEETLPQVLVLHHTNARSKRWELVDLDEVVPESINISESLPETVEAEERFVTKLKVSNDGDYPVDQLAVEAVIAGASIELVTTASGSCEEADEVNCVLGTLAPGASAVINLQLKADDDADRVTVEVKSTTAASCETTLSLQVPIRETKTSPAILEVAGGCACDVAVKKASSPWRSSGYRWWGLGLLALALRRRKTSMSRSAATAVH